MVRRAINAITGKISGLHRAAFWLAGFSLLSLILGFLRDRLLAHHFGAGETLDIYYAAFEIPDILFATVASLVSASILVPVFALKKENKESLHATINSIFSSFSILIIASCIVVWILMPVLVKTFFGSLGEEATLEVIKLSRILLLSPFFLGFSNFFGSIVQFEKRFLLYSLSPLLYNAGIIGGLVFGATTFGISSAIFGVALGAFLHMLTQALFVFSTPEAPRLIWNLFSREIRKIFLLSIPRTISLSASSLVGLLLVSLASKLNAGSIAVFTLALNLQSVLLSLIGSSYSLAAFPTLAEHYNKKESAPLIKCLSDGLRHIVFWSLPASALFIVLRAHIVRVVLGSGAFDWSDTRMTAAVLAIFVASVVFQSIQLFLTRAHYAFSKTKLPLVMNLAGAVFTIFLAIIIFNSPVISDFVLGILVPTLKVTNLPRVATLILPLTFSLGAMLSAILLWFSLDHDLRGGIKESIGTTARDSLFVSITVALSTLAALRIWNDYFVLDTLLNVLLHGTLSGLVGIVCGITMLVLLKNRETEEIFGSIKRKQQ